ncbi:site-specific DNA-methyltransferase [Sphingomonas sp.]|uniref:site-specific DNA-methyltransferase n=1 Tax=Sphingomonas sp. TaxID=28214 RepID=UPI003B00A059
MELSDDDKALIADHLARGEPLPDRFRWTLFREPREAELIWPGKTSEVTNVVLPFQSIEQIDEPRSEAGAQVADLFQMGSGGRQGGGWSNKLIWGDNKLVLSSLIGGPLRRDIEAAGGLKLVYIDPPFDIGADFSVELDVGGETLSKSASVIEEIAYRDTWGRGTDSYVHMIIERLRAIHALLHAEGSIMVHVGWAVSHIMRIALDEVFGAQNIMNQIIWKRQTAHSDGGQGARHLGRIHDVILYYRKSESFTFNTQYTDYDARYLETHYKGKEEGTGRRFELDNLTAPGGAGKGNPYYELMGVKRYWRYSIDKMDQLVKAGRIIQPSPGAVPRYKRYLDEMPGLPLQDIWSDVSAINSQAVEAVGYATQKPESLMQRIVCLASNPGDIVADLFCGSGTTIAVAEKLGRKWIGADLGRFAIHTSRKRLIGVQRELKAAGRPWRSFEILNLGKYERQWFAGIDPALPAGESAQAAAAKEAAYVALILEAYRAQPVEQSPPFHGVKDSAFIVVGPLDAPVNELTVAEAVEAARRMGVARVDVLGFEFEMGLAPRAVDDAKAKGVAVALRYIPKDVFDRRAIDKGQVNFHDLAYVEARATIADKKARRVTVTLSNFAVAYRQDGLDNLIDGMRPGTKVAVDDGQVVKLTKAKDGTVTREVLTKEWTDWIDYWAVDFDYASRPETIHETVTQADGTVKHVPQWTGRYIFENEWQSFRTRRNRALELTSATHEYATPGRKQIAVKVIDIFGNDTTKVIGVEV